MTVTRCAWRAAGTGYAHPADEALSLPAGRHSHGLARLAAAEAVRGSFDNALEAIGARCGNVVGKRQLLELVRRAAVDVDAFNASVTPLPRTADELLVLSTDAKGIVMRPEALRPATAAAAARAKRTLPHPPGRRGEARPQEDGHPRGGLRRGPGTPPPA